MTWLSARILKVRNQKSNTSFHASSNSIRAGVAARNLQECLLLQLERKKKEGKSVTLAISVLSEYFDEFTKKHYDKIQRGLNITEEEFRDVIRQIIKLNPKARRQSGRSQVREKVMWCPIFLFSIMRASSS